jgi:hypothetical protein
MYNDSSINKDTSLEIFQLLAEKEHRYYDANKKAGFISY